MLCFRGIVMILYKYYGFKAGLAALRSSQLGFRKPDYFNDPFEFTYFSNVNKERDTLSNKVQEIKNSVDVLSLTRTPLNPLMWAHYGEEHAGFVIGYDVSDEFFTSPNFNLIPVDEGDVLYTNTKTPSQVTDKDIHQIYLATIEAPLSSEQSQDSRTPIRKMFLTKHAAWVYEEEVRVVKVSDSLFESSEEFQSHPYRSFEHISRKITPEHVCCYVAGLKLYTKKQSIKEIYLGVRNPLLTDVATKSKVIDNSLKDKAESEFWKIHKITMDNSSWSLKPEEIDANSLIIRAKETGLLAEASIGGKEAEMLVKKLAGKSLTDEDSLSVTNFSGEVHVQLNGRFL
jgi:hypothetical protein